MYPLAIAQQKGGTGKTTVALNTAGALAKKDYKVVVVDLDAQGNATEGLGKPDASEAGGPNLRNALLEDNVSFADIAVKAAHDDIALLPSHASFSDRPRLEYQLDESTANIEAAVRALTGLLEDSGADIAILDCPPTDSPLSDVGLLTAGRMLIPAKASGTSIRAMKNLLQEKRSVESDFGVDPIQPIGVVANEVRQSGVSDTFLEWLEDTFGDSIPVWELRIRVALERAWMNGSTIYTHDEECPHAIEVFDSIAEHIEGQL